MGATVERESKFDIIQVGKIYLRAGILAVIGIGSKLKYISAPTINNDLDIVYRGWVLAQINSIAGAANQTFAIGDASPVIIANWNTTYEPVYGTGKFWVQFKNADGSITDRWDIPVTRIIDRTIPAAPVQTSVSLDFGGLPLALAGQIIIEVSNVPIL